MITSKAGFLIFKIDRGDADYDDNYGQGGWNDFWRTADCRSSAVALVEHDRNGSHDYHIVDLEGLTMEIFEKGLSPDQLKRKQDLEAREEVLKLEVDWLKAVADFQIKYRREMTVIEEAVFKPTKLMNKEEVKRLKSLKLHYLDDLKTIRALDPETQEKLST